jgi:hypothetical protein
MPIISKRDGTITNLGLKNSYFEGLSKVQEVTAGDMCYCWSGRFEIGDTIADYENQKL